MLCAYSLWKKLPILVLILCNLFASFASGGLSLVLPIFKPFGYGFDIFSQIQELLDIIQKLD
jgi:hypothetical protein